jgi:hypothetical protein
LARHSTTRPAAPIPAMRGKDPNKASLRRKEDRDTGRRPVAIVVDVGDHHRANAVVAWARSDLGSLDIKANGPESPGLSLFWAQPRTSQCVRRRAGPGRRR